MWCCLGAWFGWIQADAQSLGATRYWNLPPVPSTRSPYRCCKRHKRKAEMSLRSRARRSSSTAGPSAQCGVRPAPKTPISFCHLYRIPLTFTQLSPPVLAPRGAQVPKFPGFCSGWARGSPASARFLPGLVSGALQRQALRPRQGWAAAGGGGRAPVGGRQQKSGLQQIFQS